MERRRVVITGLGVVAPNGVGEKTFWNHLVGGVSGVNYISAFDPTPYSCQIAAEVRDFVANDFMTGRSAKTMARFSQFGIAATRMALENANFSISSSLSSQVGICYGTCVNGAGDYFDEAALQLRAHGAGTIKPWAVLEYPPHAAASYIAIEFGITGPALSVSSNCCTGIDAIHTAAEQIASGQLTVAIAGASDAPIFPVPFGGFCSLGALTKRNHDPHGASRPYDLLRDGLVLGEGAATLVLEDLDFARARDASIYAEVVGYGAASEAIGMRKGDLEGNVMASALMKAITAAALQPSDIDHINAHGSSLPDFDVCDTNAFKKALGEHAYRIPISSIKSMIGQPISAAGAIQAAAACLSIQHQTVPPTINQHVPDVRCDLDYVPNRSRRARVRRVLLNGHSFGGSVSAMVLARLEE